MNAPAFPPNPSVGQRFQGFVWNGATWTCAPATGVQVITTVFTVSGPYMPSPGLVSVTVEAIGGGGSGGGVNCTSVTQGLGGGGGGSGGYSRKTLPGSLVAGGVQVTIGAGAVVAPGANGGNGGPTTFGALCVANGGAGGIANDTASGNQWGAGGAPAQEAGAVGDFITGGNPGVHGTYTLTAANLNGVLGGAGGSGPFGGGAGEAATTAGFSVAGLAANGFGGGGGGGSVNSLVATVAGGNGGSGACIVTEYCWADVVPGEDCFGSTGLARVERFSGQPGWNHHED